MLRRFVILALLITSLWPGCSLAARLELRPAADHLAGSVQVGDEIEVEIWVDSDNRPLSGAAVFLSFDPAYFALIDVDRQPALGGFQPFLPGAFLSNGETFRNDLLTDDDPGGDLTGVQLDYSVVRAADAGSGILAAFRLRALAPTRSTSVRIDESGLRETRVFNPDGTQAPFRFIAPLNLAIQGITIKGLPRQVVLARGQVDSTSLPLSESVFDPLHGTDAIHWQVSGGRLLDVILNPQTQIVTLNAPPDASAWEQLIFTATNPDGQSTSDTVDVFVNAAPHMAVTDPIRLVEDQPFQIQLDRLATDPDTPADQLDWFFTTAPELRITLSGPPYQATFSPAADWHGTTLARIRVSDNFGFADSAQVRVEIEPINDPPRLPSAPNIRLIVGKTDSSLTLESLIKDPDDSWQDLLFTWSRTEHVQVENRGGRLHLSAPLDWHGSEEILLRVEDPAGLSATAPLTVQVVPSLPPALIDPPARMGLVAGGQLVLDLQRLAVDPDDPTSDLQWRVSGQTNLRVRLSEHAARIEAPAGFSGTETLAFTVSDPSGSEATFVVLFFAAAKDGGPTFAPLPPVSLPLAGIDTSIDLDDFVFDPDHRADQLVWIVPQRDDLLVRVDPETRILTLSPTPSAVAGSIALELRLRDPDGHEAIQVLRVILLGDTPTAALWLAPIADISLGFDQTFSLALDTLVEGTLPADQLQWAIEAPAGIVVDYDESARLVQLRRTAGFADQVIIAFTATAPNGEALTRSATVLGLDTAPAIALRLAPLPLLQITAGAFDNSLDLDDFVRGADGSSLTWEVEHQQHVNVLIDPQTHVLVVLADADWSGNEILLLKGRDAQGNTVEGILQIQILAAAAPLALNETLETNLFSGDSTLVLPLEQLLISPTPAADLTWIANGDQPLEVSYDPAGQSLTLQAAAPWQRDAIIRLTASDSAGNQATTHILVRALPLDGSTGQRIAQFRTAVVPNALQPEFLDLFILSDTTLASTPRLRLKATAWSDLDLNPLAAGIWYGRHVLRPGQEGRFTVMALALDAQRQALKSEFDFFVGTVTAGQAKRLDAGNVRIQFPATAFAAETPVAVWPTATPSAAPGLIARSPAYTLYAPQSYRGSGGTIRISAPGAEDERLGIYYWNALQQQWDFAGATRDNGTVQAPLLGPGQYALFSDHTAPQLLATQETPTHSRFLWQDQGSGLAEATLYINEQLLPDALYRWQQDWLVLDTEHLMSNAYQIRLQVSDRAGNRTTVEKQLALQHKTPRAFSLAPNFPNPFNPETTIPLFIAAQTTAPVRIDIYNTAGQRVRRLLDRPLPPGAHHIVWDARDDRHQALASGIYIYRVTMEGHTQARKLNLMR